MSNWVIDVYKNALYSIVSNTSTPKKKTNEKNNIQHSCDVKKSKSASQKDRKSVV